MQADDQQIPSEIIEQQQQDRPYNNNQEEEEMIQNSDEEFYRKYTNSDQPKNYPINDLPENKLLVIGKNNHRLLTKISSVYVKPSSTVLQKYHQTRQNRALHRKETKMRKKMDKPLQRYFDKRFFLFQKFDQGIQLDEQSWYSVTPQSVAEYVASKVKISGRVLDAFCGAGGDSIKLAHRCGTVVSNDIDPVKIECLKNNAGIYKVKNIETRCGDFFTINPQVNVEAVYLAPPWGGPNYHEIEDMMKIFMPPLSKILEKSFELSKNVFFLLPVNTNIEELAATFARTIMNKNICTQTMTLRLDKVFFNGKLKFIGGYFGDQKVQSEVKLAEELQFIYEITRQQEGLYPHKKLIKTLRKRYGLVSLLNFLFSCENITVKGKNPIEMTSMPIFEKLGLYLDQKNILPIEYYRGFIEESNAEFALEVKHKAQRNKRKRINKSRKRNALRKQAEDKEQEWEDVEDNEQKQQVEEGMEIE